MRNLFIPALTPTPLSLRELFQSQRERGLFILPCEAEDEDFEQILPLKNAPSGAFGFLVFAVA